MPNPTSPEPSIDTDEFAALYVYLSKLPVREAIEERAGRIPNGTHPAPAETADANAIRALPAPVVAEAVKSVITDDDEPARANYRRAALALVTENPERLNETVVSAIALREQ